MSDDALQTKVRAEDFEAMEAAAGLKFDPIQRKEIEQALQEYERDCRLVARLKDRTELERGLEKVGSKAEKLRRKHDSVWQQAAGCKSALSVKVKAAEELQNLVKTGRATPPDYVRLWKLLLELERIFKSAGGELTGIHRGDKPVRGGPFPEFANAAVRCLPEAIRPKGIVSAWDELNSKRKKGHAGLVSATLPRGLSSTFTSNWPRRR